LYRKSDNEENRGTTNRFALTYKYRDADGTEHTVEKYYNYVFKGTDYDCKDPQNPDLNDLRMEEGPIYLAEIKPVLDENGNQKKNNKGELLWRTERVEGANDNYKELVNAINNQYNEAEAAVQAAAEKVAKLQGQISEIQRVGKVFFNGKWLTPDELAEVDLGLLSEFASDDPYIQLVFDLKIAEQELSTAQDNVDEAKRILDSIDLSRFTSDDDGNTTDDVTTGGDESTGGGETTGGGESTGGGTSYTYDAGTGILTVPGLATPITISTEALASLGITPAGAGAATAGVLGVRTGGGNGAGGTEADEGGAADTRTNVAPRADFGTVNKVLGSKQNKKSSQLVKRIEDNEIPLAEMPTMDDEVTMNWMWLLIIFLLGATGKKMYDEYKKKKEAEEAAKIDK
jgi:hypothetical protein